MLNSNDCKSGRAGLNPLQRFPLPVFCGLEDHLQERLETLGSQENFAVASHVRERLR